MKVVHFRKIFSQLTETFVYDLLVELDKQKIENHIITIQRKNRVKRPFPHVEVAIPFGKSNPKRLFRKFVGKYIIHHHPKYMWKASQKKVHDLLIKKEPDVIHAHFGRGGVYMASIAQALNIPFVISFHGHDAFGLTKKKFWSEQYRAIGRQKVIITCVSEYMKNYLSNYFPENKIRVVHVGKKLDNYCFRLPEKKIENWLSIGRFKEKKGFDDAIKAFSQIVEKYPNQTLRIIGGGGRLKSKMNRLIKELNMEKNIFLLGALPHTEVKQELQHADAFILTSKMAKNGDMEGVPTVLMEAQAVGKPCVSTLHSGIPEVFPECAQSFLAEEKNIDNIVQKIEDLLSCSVEELQKISQAGREKIMQDFNIEKEAKKLIQIYYESLA